MFPCTHPSTTPITRAGNPTGKARCTACGAVLGEDGTREVNGL